MIISSNRLSSVPDNFYASLNLRLEALKAQEMEIIRLDVGSPDLPPAPHIIEALRRSASLPNSHGYIPHRGIPALRVAWADTYRRLYGVELDPETEVLPLMGSKEGIAHFSLAFVQPSDVVLATDPGYMTYANSAILSGGEVYSLRLESERDYLPDLEQIPQNILRKTKLMWLNYPNNPTASIATGSFFTRVIAMAQEFGFLVCHDAVYAQIAFDGERPLSILEIPGAKQVAVEFNTLSKSYNMAGWRTGVVVGNASALESLFKLKTIVDSGHFLPILEASTIALTSDQSWLRVRNLVYQQRRDAVIAGLHDLGLLARIPAASIYVWSPIPTGWKSVDFTVSVLDRTGVSLTPGTVFGAGGEGYVRIALTAPLERIQTAMERLKDWKNKN